VATITVFMDRYQYIELQIFGIGPRYNHFLYFWLLHTQLLKIWEEMCVYFVVPEQFYLHSNMSNQLPYIDSGRLRTDLNPRFEC